MSFLWDVSGVTSNDLSSLCWRDEWYNVESAGTFGRVLECWDREDQDYVAIKVIRNVQKYRDAAMIEIDVLRVLAKHDKTGSRSVL